MHGPIKTSRGTGWSNHPIRRIAKAFGIIAELKAFARKKDSPQLLEAARER